MPKVIAALFPLVLCSLVLIGVATAADPPHDYTHGVGCNSCHIAHNALGQGLTTDTNSNLCLSCHKVGGTGGTKPFSTSMQATPGTSGISHRWDSPMPAVSSPTNQYGLRAAADLVDVNLKTRLTNFNNVVTCSVCHQQHNQLSTPWDPSAAAGTVTDTGTASGGSTTTVVDGTKAWTANYWAGYYVKVLTGSNAGQEKLIQSNTATTLTVASPFTAAVAPPSTYVLTTKRHFVRTNNDLNQLCEDCHYYKTPASAQTNVRTYTGSPLSHPVSTSAAAATSPAQYHATPREPQSANWAVQTGTRFSANGATDTNATNNLVLDPAGQIRCLTCHGMHYTDSNSATVDQP